MILSKATFIRAMELIHEQDEIMDAVRQQLSRLGDKPSYFNIDSLHLRALLDVMGEAMADTNDWIGWWLYEDVEKIVEWDEDGKHIRKDVTEPAAFWEFLYGNAVSSDIKHFPRSVTPSAPGQVDISEEDFHLMFEACQSHISKTDDLMRIKAEDGSQFVIMSQRRYDRLVADTST